MKTENLSTLKIHKLTQEQYNRELEAGRIDENALYLTPDEEIDLSPYATVEELTELQDDIDENKDAIAVERARINQFVALEEGSTTGDAELLDVRVGYNGKIYQSAGDAVRGQIGNLADEMHNVIETDYPTNFFDVSEEDFRATGASNCNIEYTDHTLTITEISSANHYVTCPIIGRLISGKSYILSYTCTGLGENGYINLTDGSAGPEVVGTVPVEKGYYFVEFVASIVNNLYFTVKMPYNISSVTVSNISITEVGDVPVSTVRNETIKNLDVENMTEKFLEDIGYPNNPCEYKGNDISMFNKILCVGDSLTSGAFNHSDGITTIEKYSYPKQLSKLSNVPCTNLGNGGKTSDEWYMLHSEDDLSGYDCAIIQLGVNDALRYDGWTDTSITAFTNIINKLKTENAGIKIFIATVIPSISFNDQRHDTVSQGIRELVASLNDENVILLDMAEYGHTAKENAYNCGHLSAYGYWQLAKDYMSYISWYINQNKILFREVQFIGTEYKYE